MMTRFMLCAVLFMASVRAGSAQDVLYRYIVENMRGLNSIYSELSMVPQSDSTYLLVSDRGAKNKQGGWSGGVPYDLFLVDRNDWTIIHPLTALNTRYNDGPVSFWSDREAYITQTSKRGQFDPHTGQFIYRLSIVKAVFQQGRWTSAPLPAFQSKKSSYAHPSISPDGKMLFLVSDLPGGFGGNDIYVSYRRGNGWSEPVNLGETVNSSRDELFPFYHQNGSLYFSSNRQGGLGGHDIYETHKVDVFWTVPRNLGEPVNSPAHEYSIYFDDEMERGYLSSNRLGGRGGDDIYAIFIDKTYLGPAPEDAAASPPETQEEEITEPATYVPPKASAAPVQAPVKPQDAPVPAASPIPPRPSAAAPPKPAASVPAAPPKAVPAVKVVQEARPDPVQSSQHQALDTFNQILVEEQLQNVYFAIGSDDFDEEGRRVMDRLVALLNQYEDPVLELHAHADATGNYQQNVQLTEKRARSVMQYLIDKGVPLSRMSYRAYGESDLAVQTEEGVRMNRRVEFRLKLFRDIPATAAVVPDGSYAKKSLGMLERGQYYVQVAALSPTSLFRLFNLREYGAPVCYFDQNFYKYVLGPYGSYEAALADLPHVRKEYRDAFIFRNE